MRNIFLACFVAFAFYNLNAQKSMGKWKIAFEPQQVFIENKGQFESCLGVPNAGKDFQGSKILYATENYSNQILFAKDGLTFRLEERIQPSEEQREEREEEMKQEREEGKTMSHQEMERKEHRLIVRKDFIQMKWENSNPDVEVIAQFPVDNYFNFSVGNKRFDHVSGYQKLLYKNLYQNIDVEYVFHPEGGIEYSFILHPGADASQIVMQYPNTPGITIDENGNLLFPTLFGNIVEHAPETFYSAGDESRLSAHLVSGMPFHSSLTDGQAELIVSKFVNTGNRISIKLEDYDHTKEVVIDPWVQTPNLSLWKPVWECEKDGAGNVYIIGGDHPMKLQKYNTTGVLQWTYTTTWVGDTADGYDWLGTMATDQAGNSYISNGSLAELKKINASGTELWYYTAPALSCDEYWSIAFNCDETKLIVGGTSSNSCFPVVDLYGAIFEINTNTGNIISKKQVGKLRPPYSILGFPIPFSDAEEVRSLTSSKNGRYYFLTLDSIGAFDQNLSACPNGSLLFNRNHGYALGYKSETYRINNSGIKAIKANGNYVYTQNGAVIQKRNLNTGTVITTVNIPGGINTVTNAIGFNFSQAGNSGIDIDVCGNVYVGSATGVIKYDSNLVQLSSVATTFPVFDVAISTNGDVIACGATNVPYSTSRVGYVQSFSMGACAPLTLVCCDANICPAGPFCATDGPVTLSPAVTAGTFSGTGITNPLTGTFNPSVAGPGIHLVTNTIGCGSGSLAVIVSPCGPLHACAENNGNITVSNGVGPYLWDKQVQQQDCSACLPGFPPIIPPCSIPAGCAVTVNVWQYFATGATVTPPGTYPLQVTDELGTVLQITSLASLPACSACALTASTSTTNSTCGTNSGTATVSVIGGSPTSYSWSSGATTALAANLTPGTYTVTVSGLGCSVTASATVISSGNVTASLSSTNAVCTNNGTATVIAGGGTGSYTYIWSNGSTSSTISNLAASTYSVTVSSGTCSSTASTVVNSTGSVTASASAINAGCISDGSATVTPGGGTGSYTYLWNNGGTVATISNLPTGTYMVTVTSGNCTSSVSAVVNSTNNLSASAISTNAGCASNGTATVTPAGGTGSYAYLWSSGGTTATISNLSGGTYLVTVSSGTCSATASALVNTTGGVTASASTVNAICGANGSAAVIAGGGNGTYSYLWNTGATTASLTNISAGTYLVTVTSGSCSATASAVVSGSNTIILSITPVNSSCSAGGAATANSTGGTGTYIYLWSNAGTAATISNITPGTYFLTVTSGSCSITDSTTIISTGSLTSTVLTTNSGCNSTGAVTVSPAGGTGTFAFHWNTGGTMATISNLSAGTYVVTVTSGNCTVTDTADVISSGGVTLTISSSGTSCGYTNGTAGVSASTGTGPFNYLWSNGATLSSISNLNAGSYSVTVNDFNGCSATAGTTISISTIRRPVIIFDQNIMCSGDSAHLCVDSNYVLYQWNTGPTSKCIYAQLAGNYYATVTDNFNCTVESNHQAISVYPNPPVSISVNGDTLRAYNAISYQWYLNSVAIPNATDSIYIARIPGDYSVAVRDSNGCFATSTNVTISKTGIENLRSAQVKIYPNPLESGKWNLEIGNNLIGSRFEIFDAEGRLIFRSEIRNSKSEIDLNVSSGIYTIRINSSEVTITQKLIKL